MRVVVMRDSEYPATRLKDWLLRYDFDLTAELDSSQNLAQCVGEMLPDALIIETLSPSQQILDQLRKIHQKRPLPVLLFSKDGRSEKIKAAIRSGVTSYLVGKVNFERLPVIMRVATARFEEDRDRRRELDELKSELSHLKVITRAKAIIMKGKGCSEDEAYRSLRETAMSRSLSIGEIAEQLVEMSKLLIKI